jgi:hypothetical protein
MTKFLHFQQPASAQNHSDDSPEPSPRFPVGLQPTDLFRGESPDPLPPWAPAFAGEAVSSEVLHRRVNRVNDSEHKGTLSDWRSEIALLHAGRPRHALTRALGKAIHLYGDRSKVHPAGVMLGVNRGLLDELRARLAEP